MKKLAFAFAKVAAVVSFLVFFIGLAKVTQHSALAAWQADYGFELVSLSMLAVVLSLGAVVELRMLRPFLRRNAR